MLLVRLAADFLVNIENHNSEGKERKIDKGRRRKEKAIGHYLENSRKGTQQRCHLFPILQLTFSSQWLSQDISLFLHEISLSLEISVHESRSLQFLRKKNSGWHE